MNRKVNFLLVNLAIIALLLINTGFSTAASPEWSVGDIYLWGTMSKVYEVNDGIKSETTLTSETKINITSIDIISQRYDAHITTSLGSSFQHNIHYGAADFVSSSMHLSNFLQPSYIWDYEYNRTVLVNVNFNLDYLFLIEPDWAVINKGYRDMLNGSEVIATVNDPYTSTIYNFTLLNVMNSLNVKINGKGSFKTGLGTFTDKRSKWTFSFDMSGVLHKGESNGSMILYYPYEKATINVELEYKDGGTLKNFDYVRVVKYKTPNINYEGNFEQKVTLGGFKSVQASFATMAAIAGLMITAGVVIIRKRKRV